MTDVSRSDRIAYPETVSAIYDALKEESGSIEVSPFKTFKDIFMFAVLLGFNKGVRHPLPSGSKKTIRLEVFTRQDRELLQAVAVAEAGSLEILNSPSSVISIVEEYGHTGIHDLQAELLNRDGKSLWNLVSLVSSKGNDHP